MKEKWMYTMEWWEGEPYNGCIIYRGFALATSDPAEAIVTIIKAEPGKKVKSFSGPNSKVWTD